MSVQETVQQLKNAILQLAIQGKLVPQDPNDEPASVLLQRIRQEKEKLVKQGKIKPEKKAKVKKSSADNAPYALFETPESDFDPLFEIPENWAWARLQNITYNVGNKKNQVQSKYVKSTGKIRVVSQSQNMIDGYTDEVDKQIDTLPLVMFGDHTRTVKYIDFPFVIGADGTKFHKVIVMEPKYLYYWMLITSTELRDRGYARHYTLLTSKPLPIPPLLEQRRIVAKIEELFSQLDSGLERLKKVKSQIETFRKLVLKEAIEGRLVEQDPNDEPATALLQRIRQEKERLIKEGKIKRDKKVSTIVRRGNSHYEEIDGKVVCIDDQLPFEIPESWAWARASSLGVMVRGSGIKRSDVINEGIGCIRYGEIYTTYETEFETPISFISSELACKCRYARQGDILFTLTGENKPDIAKAVAYMGKERISIGGDLARWTHHGLAPLYLSYFMQSPYCIARKSDLATGDLVVHISIDRIQSIYVPIPPLNEQHRIVDKILSLFNIAETLKNLAFSL